jgi:tetratricopeptide (TPR) repeat protein
MAPAEPADPKDFLASVDALLQQRLFDPAQELAHERLRHRPDDVDARIALCKVWTKMGQLDRVDESLRELESRIADWARVYAAMGDLCRESGFEQEAIRFYRRFMELRPVGTPHQDVAEKLSQLMDTGAASLLSYEDHYTDIDEIAPDFHTLTLADLYLRQHQLEMARDVLKEILKREPDHEEAARKLREVENRLLSPQGEPNRQERDQITRELTRWLQNLCRIGSYAA